jgi:ribonuclease D
MPQPLIDTQILAAFSGRPLSWGFAAMVESIRAWRWISESRTDWLARPLTERQWNMRRLTCFTCCRLPDS